MKHIKKFNENVDVGPDEEEVLDIFQEVLDEFSITRYSSSDRRIPFSTNYPENSITYGNWILQREGCYGKWPQNKLLLDHFNEMRIKIVLTGDKLGKANEIENYINVNLKERYDNIGLEISTDQLAQGFSGEKFDPTRIALISLVALIKLK
jgi:hypothetical protein